MNNQLFKDVLNALLSAAEQRRYQAREKDQSAEADRWSAIAGNLDYARKHLRP